MIIIAYLALSVPLLIDSNITFIVAIFLSQQLIPITYAAYHTFKYSFFKLGFSLIMSNLYIIRFYHLNNFSKRILSSNYSLKTMMSITLFIIEEHCTLCSYIYLSNPLWSILLAIFVWLNIPINIFWLNQLSRFEMNISEFLLIMIAALCQLVGNYIVILHIALINKHAHKLKMPLYKLLMSANKFPIKFKLKVSSYMEKVMSNHRIGVTIGTSTVITVRGVFKVSSISIFHFLH